MDRRGIWALWLLRRGVEVVHYVYQPPDTRQRLISAATPGTSTIFTSQPPRFERRSFFCSMILRMAFAVAPGCICSASANCGELCLESLMKSAKGIYFTPPHFPNFLGVSKWIQRRDHSAPFIYAARLQSKTRLPVKPSSKKFWVCLGIETRNP